MFTQRQIFFETDRKVKKVRFYSQAREMGCSRQGGILKLKANPGNPVYDVLFNPKYQILYADKESATDSLGIHCKKLLKKAKIDVGGIAINSIHDVLIWDSEPVTVDFSLSEFDKSSTSTIFKSRFYEVKEKYLDFCDIYTDGSKVETKVASAYVCPYGTRDYRLRDGCSIFTAEIEAINKALTYVKESTTKSFVMFSDSMSVLQAIESLESKNPLVNRVLQACREISSNGKFITFCWIPSQRYHRKRTCWSCCKRCFIKSTTYTFWTAMYRYYYEDSAICLIFVAGTVE